MCDDDLAHLGASFPDTASRRILGNGVLREGRASAAPRQEAAALFKERRIEQIADAPPFAGPSFMVHRNPEDARSFQHTSRPGAAEREIVTRASSLPRGGCPAMRALSPVESRSRCVGANSRKFHESRGGRTASHARVVGRGCRLPASGASVVVQLGSSWGEGGSRCAVCVVGPQEQPRGRSVARVSSRHVSREEPRSA